MDYRTKDGSAEFGFSIEFKLGVGWRVYIILDPFHQNHTDNFDLPYQSIDRDERRYVSWAAKVDSLGDAKTLAGVWAELVQRDQRARKKHELHLELIRLCRCTQKNKGSPEAVPSTAAERAPDTKTVVVPSHTPTPQRGHQVVPDRHRGLSSKDKRRLSLTRSTNTYS
jgi:hypothetical protein